MLEKRMNSVQRQYGFTLIELLVVLAIMAILAAIASPSYFRFIQQERHSRTVNVLSAFYKLARSEATKREQGLGIVWNSGKVQLQQPDNTVLKTLDLTSYDINVDGLTSLAISATGSAMPGSSIRVSDPQGVANTKWLCVLTSGQLYISATECAG
jgi:type II secretion system protein H